MATKPPPSYGNALQVSNYHARIFSGANLIREPFHKPTLRAYLVRRPRCGLLPLLRSYDCCREDPSSATASDCPPERAARTDARSSSPGESGRPWGNFGLQRKSLRVGERFWQPIRAADAQRSRKWSCGERAARGRRALRKAIGGGQRVRPSLVSTVPLWPWCATGRASHTSLPVNTDLVIIQVEGTQR